MAINVSGTGGRSWVLRFQVKGRRRDLGLGGYPNVTLAQAKEAASASVAKQAGIPLVPFLMAGIATRPEMFQADGLHPVAKAQPSLLETVWQGLKGMLGSR